MYAPHFTHLLKPVNSLKDLEGFSGKILQYHEVKIVHHEGDEESKRRPGHGYPEYNEEIYIVKQFIILDLIGTLTALEQKKVDISRVIILEVSNTSTLKLRTEIDFSVSTKETHE